MSLEKFGAALEEKAENIRAFKLTSKYRRRTPPLSDSVNSAASKNRFWMKPKGRHCFCQHTRIQIIGSSGGE
jgi:hypothetical protein